MDAWDVFLICSMLFHVTLQQEITDAECGKTMACIKMPQDCTASSNCDVLITFKHIQATDEMEFTLSSRKNWIAATQVEQLNPSARMAHIKGQVCFKSGSDVRLKSLKNAGWNGTPGFVSPVSGITDMTFEHLSSTAIICKFKRKVTVASSDTDYLYDFNKNLYMVYAADDNMSGSNPGYHLEGLKGWTTAPADFKFKPEAPTTLPPTTTVSTTTTQAPTTTQTTTTTEKPTTTKVPTTTKEPTTTTQQPSTTKESSTTEKPTTTEQTTTKQPTTTFKPTQAPTTTQPTTKPTTKATTEEPSTSKSSTKEPTTKEKVTEKPTVKPTTKKAVTQKPTKPPTQQPTKGSPGKDNMSSTIAANNGTILIVLLAVMHYILR